MEEELKNDEIFLLYDSHRIPASRSRLSRKSLYFETLFRPYFEDGKKTEFHIDYDVSVLAIQTFISWADEEVATLFDNHHFIKPSLLKYTIINTGNYEELINLLRLSVILIVQSLWEDLTDIITRHWLIPEIVVDVWSVAEELNLEILRDVAKATCLDRFEELPIEFLSLLSKDKLMRLISNVNLRASYDHLRIIEMTRTDSCFMGEILKCSRRPPSYLQCIVGRVISGDAEGGFSVFSWNGIALEHLVNFFEKEHEKNLVGMQVIGRGYSIYVVGGEYGLGSGRFNVLIWRYCLLSKKWYYTASLPEPRRHMAVAFLGDKLILVGGVGRYRSKLRSVQLLNIYTGEWTRMADVWEDFTAVPPTCVINEMLLLCKSDLYIYHLRVNFWKKLRHLDARQWNSSPVEHLITIYNDTVYFAHSAKSGMKTCLSIIDRVSAEATPQLITECKTLLCNTVIDPTNSRRTIGFSFTDDEATVEEMIAVDAPDYCKHALIYSKKRDDLKNLSFKSRIGCFNILNPQSLNDVL